MVLARSGWARGLVVAIGLGAGGVGCGGDDPASMAVTAVEPAVGSARGGETVTLRGQAFAQGSSVSFGDTPAREVTWLGAEALEVLTPWHVAATVDVVVSSGPATAAAEGAFTFEPLELELVQAASHYVPDLSMLTVDDAVVGDFDGDEALDVLVAVRGTPSRLLRNSGTGALVDSLPLPDELEPDDPIDTWVHSTRRMLVEDLDGDGDLDVFLCNRWGQPNRIYENDGDGAFSLLADALAEVSEECRAAVFADVDGDEDADLVVVGRGRIGGGQSYLRVYERSSETVAFEPRAELEQPAEVAGEPVGAVQVSPAPVVAEYVITDEEPAQGAGAGHGTFVFSAEPGEVIFSHAVQTLEAVPEAVELDLRVSAAAVSFTLRLVDDEGESYSYDLAGATGSGWQQVRAEDPASWTAAGGDADGVLDLPLASVQILVSDPAGAAEGEIFVDDIRMILPRTGPVLVEDFERLEFALAWDEVLHSVAAGDLDGDGDLDLVLSSEHGAAPLRLRLLRNDTTASDADLELRETPASAFETTEELIAFTLLHDVDDDGDLDLWALARDGQDRLLVNDGRAHFFDDTVALLPVDAARGVFGAAADLDLDGRQDLLMANYGAANRIYRSRGAAGYADITPVMPIHTARSLRLLPLDADGDGDLDLFELNQSGERSLLYVSVEPEADE